jgi:hypothetical protein
VSPEDKRHGTHRGYVVGCRLLCCTAAHTRYMKLYRLGRIPRLVDATGTIRRIRALQALGWTYAEMGQQCGRSENWAYMIPRSPQVTSTTASRMARVYEELCMVVPDGPYAERTRRMARRKGWPPPLAWDDIDRDPQANYGGTDADIDPVVVMRLLEGRRVKSTPAEKEAAMARWVADGGSRAELCRWHGWHQGRYSVPLRLIEGDCA